MFYASRKIGFALLLGTTMLSPVAMPGPASAADAAPAAKAADTIETVTVTARRRSESLEDVPIAVTAFSAQRLSDAGASNISYLTQATPNVTFSASRSTNSTLTAFIRGVGQQDPVAGFESGVGLYIDDVYINRPQGALVDIYDIDHIEVLRGPQGTLYGRNTIGGAIKYVTRPLSDDPELRVRLSGGTYGQFDAVVTASTPITDTLKVGGSFAYLHHDGYGRNLVQQGVDNYNQDLKGGRLTAEFTPNSDLTIKVSGDYTVDDSDPRQGHRLLPSQFTPGYPVLKNVYDTQSDMTYPKELVVTGGVSGVIQWRMNDNLTFKNILAYRNNYSHQQIDFDGLPVNDFNAPFKTRDNQLSEEFQALYSSAAINGVAGVYYLNAGAFDVFDVYLGELGSFLHLPGLLNAFTLGNVKTDTWAVYGDVTFDLADLFGWTGPGMRSLALEIGGRYTSDQRTAFILRQTMLGASTYFGGTPFVLASTSNFNGSATFSSFTPRISLSWKPTDTQNYYVSYSEGFKGGGFDPRGATTATPDYNNDGIIEPSEVMRFMEFRPEKITTYETGVKTDLFGRRANANVALFYSDYKDVQIPGAVGIDTNHDGIADTFAGITTNAGKATIYGAEFEGTGLVGTDMVTSGDSLMATASVGWIHARYDTFMAAVTDPVTHITTLQNVANRSYFQNTPSWTSNFSITYARPLTLYGEGGTLSLINSLSNRSLMHQYQYASPIDQPAYSIYDASLVWASDSGRWQIGIYGKNLTDTRYKIAGYDFVTATKLGLEGDLTAFYGDPRTVTATLQINL